MKEKVKIQMDNRDYNEPMRDYCAPEEERYERPSYAYSQFENNYNSNNSNYYNSGRYANVGGVILDNNGKPLKNSFGMKLTFSILEMLCCCASCFTLVTGILSCIFTCQANTCYKEGRYDEYKSKSNVSTILLIVGAIFAAISICFNGLSMATSWDDFWDEFMYEFEIALEDELGYDVDMDTFWDDLDKYEDGIYDNDYYYDDEDYEDFYNQDAVHENFEDFNQVIVDGVTVSLPCTYAELETAGFFLNPTDQNAEIEAGTSCFYELHSKDKAYIADVQIDNNTDKTIKAKDGLIIYLDFYYESIDEKEIFDGYEFVNGLTVFATIDETLALLGEPNSGYFEDTEYGYRQYYCWDYEYADGYYSYVFVNFYDGVIYDIGINNGPY